MVKKNSFLGVLIVFAFSMLFLLPFIYSATYHNDNVGHGYNFSSLNDQIADTDLTASGSSGLNSSCNLVNGDCLNLPDDGGDDDYIYNTSTGWNYSSFTINVWFMPEVLDTQMHTLLFHGNSGGQRNPFGIYAGGDWWSDKMVFTLGNNANEDSLSSTTTLSAGTLYMGTFRYDVDTNNISIYVNGVHEASMSSTKTITWAGNFYIGCKNTGGYCFDGYVDEFMIWNESKNDSFISELYNSTNISNSLFYPYQDTGSVDNPPTYSNIGVNSTQNGTFVNFSSLWNDDNALSGYIFSTNNTGSWINESFVSFSGQPEWANVFKVLNNTVGNIVSYQWYANDSSDNWNNTGVQSLTITDVPMEWFDYFDNGLVHYWVMNSSSGNFIDYGIDGADLTVTDGSSTRGDTSLATNLGASWNKSGDINTAIASTTSAGGSGSSVTSCVWIQMNSMQYLGFISASPSTSGNKQPFSMHDGYPNMGRFAYEFGNTDNPIETTANYTLGETYFVCGMYDHSNSNQSIWINGEMNVSETRSVALSWASTFVLGKRGDYQGADMSMSDFMVWNRTLNASEISKLYAGGDACSKFMCDTSTPSVPEYISITLNNPSNLSTNFESITNLTIITNTSATCEYADNQTFSWGQGNSMSTNNTHHWVEIANTNVVSNYEYSYICNNGDYNVSLLNHNFTSQYVNASNVFGLYGDSTVTGSTGGVTMPMSEYITNNLSGIYYNIIEDNDGVDGSCLTKSCNGKTAFIDDYSSWLIDENEIVFYLSPHVNDMNNGVTASDYYDDFLQIIQHSKGNMSNHTILTGTQQPISHDGFEGTVADDMRVKVREVAIREEIPLLEWTYLHNWNQSLQHDEAHMNQIGHSYWGNVTWDFYQNKGLYTYNLDNWDFYGYGNSSHTLLNRTIQMPTGQRYYNTSSDWIVIKQIMDGSFYISNADKPFVFNISELVNDGAYNISLSNGTYYNDVANASGVLSLGFDAVSDINVTYSLIGYAPLLNIISPINISYDSTSINLNVTGVNNSAYLYNLNAGGNTSFVPNITIMGFEGYNELIIYSNNTEGVYISSNVYFNVDTLPSTITITAPANTTYTDSNITLSATGDDANTLYYELNSNGTNVTFTSPSYLNLSDGEYNLTVWTNDTFDRWNSSIIYFEVNTSVVTPPTGGGGGGGSTTSINLTDLEILTDTICVDDLNDIRFMPKNATGNFTLIDTALLFINGVKTVSELVLDERRGYYTFKDINETNESIEVKIQAIEGGHTETKTKILDTEMCSLVRKTFGEKGEDFVDLLKENPLYWVIPLVIFIALIIIVILVRTSKK